MTAKPFTLTEQPDTHYRWEMGTIHYSWQRGKKLSLAQALDVPYC